jgi:FkbM family methyltransferase
MIVDALRRAIRSVPVLHRLLLPIAARFDTSGPANRERFRRFCAELPRLVDAPFFVKVGANDGLTADPCADLLRAEPRWRGLLIEPVPFVFERLRANYPDTRRYTLEQVAIGPARGTATFYYVDEKARQSHPELPRMVELLGSFDREHILKHLDGRLEPFIVESTVQVRPLSEVLESHGIREVHLLQVDAEGHDDEVLQTLRAGAPAPLAIYVEHGHIPEARKQAMLGRLRGAGYDLMECAGDYFALHRETHRRLRRSPARRR